MNLMLQILRVVHWHRERCWCLRLAVSQWLRAVAAVVVAVAAEPASTVVDSGILVVRTAAGIRNYIADSPAGRISDHSCCIRHIAGCNLRIGDTADIEVGRSLRLD